MLEPIIPTFFSKWCSESIPEECYLQAIDEICRRKAEAQNKDYDFVIVSDTMIVDRDDETKAIKSRIVYPMQG